nr:hypothetical protein [Tanacetum cinerariifolium]
HKDKLLPQPMLMMLCFPSLLINRIVYNNEDLEQINTDDLEEMDLKCMRMEQYLRHIDYALWEVIVNDDAPASIASVSGGVEAAIPPKITKQKIARRNELKAKSTLLLSISNEHLLNFHGIKDANTLWEAIKTSMSSLEETGIFDDVYDDREVGAEADINNLELLTVRRTNHKDYQNCLFAYFLSQQEPKRVIQALDDPSWIEAMQEELLQFTLQNVWTLVVIPNGKRAIGTKWVFINKKGERGIVVKNKARLVAQDTHFPNKVYKVEKALYGLHQAPRACQDTYVVDILKKFNFTTVKTASTPIEPNKILIKDVKAKDVDVHLYRSMIGSLMYLTDSRPDIVFAVCACASQDTYVVDILKKFNFTTVKTASTPIEPNKILIKDVKAKDVDVHLYRSMIGSLMYLTDSRPDIVFAVCACARRTKRGQDTKIPHSSGPFKKVGDEAVYTREDDKVIRVTTIAASLEAEQESGDINKTQPMCYFDVSAAGLSTSNVGPSTSTVEDIFKDEMTTMADTLMAIRRTRPRTTSVVIYDVEEEPRRATPPPIVQSQDKEQRTAKEKAKKQEAKDVALIKQIEDVQERIDTDTLLAERLQQEEKEQFTIDEKARMLVDLIAERKRFFAAQRAEQIRNKPLTKAQLRNKMVTVESLATKYPIVD